MEDLFRLFLSFIQQFGLYNAVAVLVILVVIRVLLENLLRPLCWLGVARLASKLGIREVFVEALLKHSNRKLTVTAALLSRETPKETSQ